MVAGRRCRGIAGRQQGRGPEGEGWVHTSGHGSGTHLEFAQQVRDLEGAAWRMCNQGCACCRDLEKEKGLVGEE